MMQFPAGDFIRIVPQMEKGYSGKAKRERSFE
jgi:hypothetical protein